MCPECELKVLQKIEALDKVRGELLERLRRENRELWEANVSLVNQRAMLLKAYEVLHGEPLPVDSQTLSLF